MSAAICGATIGLVRTGLLNSYQHTSRFEIPKMVCSGYKGEKHYKNEPAVTDGK